MRRQPLVQSLIAALVFGDCAIPAYATDWLQFGYDPAHSSYNTEEKGYATPTGNVTAFHNAITLPLTAPDNHATDAIDSAPLYVSGVTTAQGQKDLIFAVSKFGMLVALDASNGAVIWSKFAAGHPTSHTNLMNGAPAVDSAKQFVYAYLLDGMIHKYAVGTGDETTTSPWPEVSSLKPDIEKGAAGLAINTAGGVTYLYSVMDGYIGDGGDYQGHLTAINLATGVQKVFNTECSDLTIHFVENGTTTSPNQTDCAGRQNGIWGRPGAIYDPGTNRLFITTGNGPFDPTNANHQGINWGDSILALNPDGTGTGSGGMPVDSYTPTTFQMLQNKDADLGSVSIALLTAPPGTAAAYQHLGVQVGKDGCVRLINLADMSGHAAPAHTGGELDALNLPSGSNCATGLDGPEIKPQPAAWVSRTDGSTWFFVTSYSDGSAAYQISLDTNGKPSLSQKWTSASGTSPVVANGIVYYLSGGKVVALPAETTAASNTPIWSSTSLSNVHWQSLIVLNEHVYAIDGASQLWSFVLDGIFTGKFE
jgi:hypothetical protein